MHPARYPGEPLIQRLTDSEREEVERWYARRTQGRERRAAWRADESEMALRMRMAD